MSSKCFSSLGFLLFAVKLLAILQTTDAWFEYCDHAINLGANGSMYVNSPNYPNKYSSGSSCRYIITAPHDYEINIQCSISMDQGTNGCSSEFFYVERYGSKNLNSAEYFCGSGYVQRTSSFRAVTLAYTSSSTNRGGAFSCLLQASPQPCDCGWSVSTKIVGGVQAGVNEFPFMTALVLLSTRKPFCGGSIINHRYVMTAAHCLNNNIAASNIAVLVGDHDINIGTETTYTQLHAVYSIRKHENYNPSTNLNDIALVATTTNIEWSRGVGPACLPFLYSFAQFDGLTAQIAGWGTTTYGGQASTVLMKATTTIASHSNCLGAVPTLSTSQMCTYSPPKDSCQYDSGGPVIGQFARLFALGVISFGQGCGGSAPGVNTRVTSHLNWLVQNTGDSFCRKS